MNVDGSVVVEQESGIHLVRLGPRMGMSEADIMAQALEPLINSPNAVVLIDLRDVELLGSRCIGVLAVSQTTANRNNARILLGEPDAKLREVLRLTRIDTLMQVVENVDLFIEATRRIVGRKAG